MIARNKTIGIDTAKATLELWESSTRDRLEIKNTDKGMKDLKKYILKVVPDFITIEATKTLLKAWVFLQRMIPSMPGLPDSTV